MSEQLKISKAFITIDNKLDFLHDEYFKIKTDNSRLRADNVRLRELHSEWLNTPFFETQEGWQEWVNEYRPRVIAALADTKEQTE